MGLWIFRSMVLAWALCWFPACAMLAERDQEDSPPGEAMFGLSVDAVEMELPVADAGGARETAVQTGIAGQGLAGLGGNPIAKGSAAVSAVSQREECQECILATCEPSALARCDATCRDLVFCSAERCDGVPEQDTAMCLISQCGRYAGGSHDAEALVGCVRGCDACGGPLPSLL